MNWKTDYRSFYYEGAPQPEDLALAPEETTLLVIDVQNTYLARPDRRTLDPGEQAHFDRWTPFHERMHDIVVPNTRALIEGFRRHGMEVDSSKYLTESNKAHNMLI